VELFPVEKFSDGSEAFPAGWFTCRDCSKAFKEGEGGKTSTYCKSCKDSALRGVRKISAREASR
jgi:hypothetical protein